MSDSPVLTPVEHQIPILKGVLHVTEYPGEGPAVVMTHGYPDDSRIYDRLIPELAGRHLVTFDFLGHGRSGREAVWPMQSGQRESELAAVIEALGLEKVTLVGHDIGGPVTIRYALAHPERVSGLVLLNTFFGDSPTLRFPELIRLMADPNFTPLVDEIIGAPQILGWMLNYTERTLSPGLLEPGGVGGLSILPQFYGNDQQPSSVAAIRAWTADLFPGIVEQNAQIADGEPARLDIPVAVAFGEHDPYLNAGVAEHLHLLFPKSLLRIIPDAKHWVQWDQPRAVASVIEQL
jgi:haloalkane dehalogenase